MALVGSNTYVEPTSGTSLNAARLQQNNNFRSLLTNFKSRSAPTSVNLLAAGVELGEQDGMLYRSATTNALYISDTLQKKSSPVGGNFTRVGIGNRVENGIVALGANAASYEIGELVATVSQDGVLAANARLYLCVSNSTSTGSTANFIDVGAQDLNKDLTINGAINASNDLTVRATLSEGAGIEVGVGRLGSGTSFVDLIGDTVYTDFGARFMRNPGANGTADIVSRGTGGVRVISQETGSIRLFTSNLERMQITSAGRVGIGTAVPSSALHVVGTVTATNFIGNGAKLTGINASTVNNGVYTVGNQTITGVKTFSSTIDGNAATATRWATARTISLSGDASGSVSIDGSDNVILPVVIDGLQTAINAVSIGTVYLGQLNTTGGGYSYTLSGLNLSSYQKVEAVLNGVDGTSDPTVVIAGVAVSGDTERTSQYVIATIYLDTGVIASYGRSARGGGVTGIRRTSSSITVTSNGGPLTTGSIRFYGVK